MTALHLGHFAGPLTAAAMTAGPLLIHELGHAAPAAWYGLPWKIRLGWLGPYVHVKGRYIAHENAAVALGGPVASIICGLLLWPTGLHTMAVLVGLLGAANVLDFWHAVKAWRGYAAKTA